MAKRPWWLPSVLVALALGACTSNAASPPSSSEAASTSASPSVVDPSSSVSSPTPSVIDPTEIAPTTSGGVSVAPLPAGLTPDQTADAEAAIEVYRRYWELSDEALSEPSRDWSQQVSGVANGTAADMLLNDISAMAQSGRHTAGQTLIETTVVKVEPAIIHLSGCVDVSETDVLNSNGQSVKVPDGPGSYQRFTTSTQVGQVQGGSWLVTVDTFDRQSTC